jgi:osmoprotectant transport system substrate-binding protein
MRKAVIVSTIVLLFVLIFMVLLHPQSKKKVTVGSKNFTEQYIVGELIRQLLEDRNFKVTLVSGLSTGQLRERMEAGEIDVCAEYTGTAWLVLLAHKRELGRDNNEVYRLVKEEEEGNGFIWLNPIWNNNTYAFASWPKVVEEYSLKTISDLASLYREKNGKIKTTVGKEFSERADGLPALKKHYNFTIAESYLNITTPPARITQSLKKHECDVALVFGTDKMVYEHEWYVYMDDKAFFSPYDLTPYVRDEVLVKYPEIADILNELVATFPGGGKTATFDIIAKCQKVWQQLNSRAEIDKMDAKEVAHEYLVKHGLIR